MKATTHEITYTERVDRWVVDIVKSGVRDFAELVAALPGVYPVEVLNSLSRLACRRRISEAARSVIVESAIPRPLPPGGLPRSTFGLPVPHPLDFDWRFTSSAVQRLLSTCRPLGVSIICLGTPTVFVTADRNQDFLERTFIDRNELMVNHVSAECKLSKSLLVNVLRDELPGVMAEVIVTDPPWYIDHIRAFLWASARMCPIGGHVVVSLPPRGTRPRMETEFKQVIRWSRHIGFAVERVRENCLAYETPPFEQNALRAVGVGIASSAWRKGTLCILEKQRDKEVERPAAPSTEQHWREVSLFGTRICFRERPVLGFDDPSLISFVKGDILPSVSRRNRLRKFVDVWTSGNRVFRCRQPGLLRSIAQHVADGGDPTVALASRFGVGIGGRRRVLVVEAAKRLTDIALMERAERRFIGKG